MDSRENYVDGVRMYSDILEVEEKAPRTNVEYFKKVEKTTSKTVIKDGSKPQSEKVVTTTIIRKDGNNPEQVSQRVVRSSGFEGDNIEQKALVSSNEYQSGYERISKKYEESSKKISSSNNSNYVSKYTSSNNNRNNVTQKTQKTQVVVSTNNKRSQPNTTSIVNQNQSYRRQNKAEVKSNRSYSSSQQTKKYTVSEAVKKQENVANTGYRNRNGNIIKRETKETKVYKSYSVPKPVIINERQSIIIQDTKKERHGEKVENYEYRETKYIRDHSKDSLVIHNRLGDPFYQIIDKTRYSSQTSNARGYKSRFDLDQNDIDKRTKTVISTVKSTKYGNNTVGRRNIDVQKYVNKNANKYQNKTITSIQRSQSVNAGDKRVNASYKNANKYQNKTLTSIQRSQNENAGDKRMNASYNKTINIEERRRQYNNANKYQNKTITSIQSQNENAGDKRMNASYKKTINIEERRRQYIPKGRFEKNLTEKTTKNIKQSESRYVNRREQNQINSSSKDRKRGIPPTQKKYQEKSEESYKRGRRQYNEKLSQKVYDTEKIKREEINKSQRNVPNQYQTVTKEIVQKELITNKYDRENEQNQQKDKEPDEQDMTEVKGDNSGQYEKETNVEKYEETYEERGNEKYNRVPQYQIVKERPDQHRQQNEQFYKREEYIYEQQKHDSQCPIHGLYGRRSQNEGRGHYMKGIKGESTYDYQYSQMNANRNANKRFGNIEEVDNYKFYESKRVEKKVDSSYKNQNILRNEKDMSLNNYQLYEQDNRSRMMQGVQMGQLGQIQQSNQSDYSKLYIATSVIPVYSEIVNQYQNININAFCNICGSPLGQSQFVNQQQSVLNTCPLHGQKMIYQQYGY